MRTGKPSDEGLFGPDDEDASNRKVVVTHPKFKFKIGCKNLGGNTSNIQYQITLLVSSLNKPRKY